MDSNDDDSSFISRERSESASRQRLVVSLRIKGDDLIPEEVSQLLRAQPTFAARQGDEVIRHGRTRVQKTGTWVLRSYEEFGWTLDEAIVQLFERLPADASVWNELIERFRVDVFCGLFMGGDNHSDGLNARTLRLLSARGVGLGLDVYGPF